ncbi:gp53-like domain-containing protein [Achromobacter xylosoxidans]|uniref:gp53-like domain-containing protein n=1 Tax=Alcaligenes xylosoxydans xylosoxydans TaxID=85698 RepID=UPI0022B86D18|nr:hypothetical protein [Achromobacter xylosoxidans]MCZ8436897.1 hypothetical protein [Achromobacter xylosoxidans]
MQTSDIPSRIPLPFANSGTKNTIPTNASPTTGLASLETGFPPITMTPIVAGGIPPAGADFNGILNLISAASRWAQAGGIYGYDAAFSAAIGGYPKGAILLNAAGTGFWLNGVDNNTTNPDSGGTNWTAVINNAASTTAAGIIAIATTAQAQTMTSDVVALTPKKLADAFAGSRQSLTANGFQVLPGGLIIQWGKSNFSAGVTSGTITLPIAFPNALLSVSGMDQATSTAVDPIGLDPGASNTTQIKFWGTDTNFGDVRWIALGY